MSGTGVIGGPGASTRDESRDAEAAVTALYQLHAVGLIRLAVVMLGDRAAGTSSAPGYGMSGTQRAASRPRQQPTRPSTTCWSARSTGRF